MYDDASWGTSVTAGQTTEYFSTKASKNELEDYLFWELNTMPRGWHFFVTNVGVRWPTKAQKDDVDLIVDCFDIEFKINDRIIRQGRPLLFQSGYGISGGIATTKNNLTFENLTNGPVGTQQVVHFPSPEHLHDGNRFNVKLRAQTAITLSEALKLTVYLQGLLRRPV